MGKFFNYLMASIVLAVIAFFASLVIDSLGFWPDDPKQATMPEQYIVSYLCELPDGGECSVSTSAVEVDLRGKIWLRGQSDVIPGKEKNKLWVKRVAGYFEVAVPETMDKAYLGWNKRKISRILGDKWPVSKFVENSK